MVSQWEFHWGSTRMAILTLSEAAAVTGKGRSTLYRYINKGLLSHSKAAGGEITIDTSELLRVFGEGALKHPQDKRESQESAADAPRDASRERIQAAEMTVELRLLREQIADIRDERDRWRQQAERSTLLLEGKQSSLWDRMEKLFRR